MEEGVDGGEAGAEVGIAEAGAGGLDARGPERGERGERASAHRAARVAPRHAIEARAVGVLCDRGEADDRGLAHAGVGIVEGGAEIVRGERADLLAEGGHRHRARLGVRARERGGQDRRRVGVAAEHRAGGRRAHDLVVVAEEPRHRLEERRLVELFGGADGGEPGARIARAQRVAQISEREGRQRPLIVLAPGAPVLEVASGPCRTVAARHRGIHIGTEATLGFGDRARPRE